MALNDIKVPKENASGTFDEITLPDATTSARGLLTSADKTKLDGLGTASTKDAPATGNASSTQVVLGNDTRIVNILKTGTAAGALAGGAGGSVNLAGGNALAGTGAGGTAGSINLSGGNALYDAAEGVGHAGTTGGSIDLSGGAGGSGGSITLRGAQTLDGGNIAAAGSINLSATLADGGAGGSIISTGISNVAGGTLNMSGGGSINTQSGGYINTSNEGGSINTSGGGGSIDLRGTGSIQFGLVDQRTTLTGTATDDRAISLPDASGTLALTSDIPSTFAASAITSGTFDNARINFAAPPAIGNTTPAAGSFTTLSASTSLTLGTSGILSGGTNTIEQRNTTSGQTFRVYNTVSGTADANYERGKFAWESNILRIGTEKAGTGTARALEFQTDGVTRLTIFTDGNATFSNNVTANNFVGQASAVLTWSTRSRIYSDADGRIRITNAAQTDFDRLQFGGTTSSYPALKRSSTTLQVRLADDSAFAPFACAGLTLNGDLTASTRNIVTDTTTGTKIGTGTTQLLGFWNATPVAQQSSTGTNATGFTANGPGNTVHADSTFTGNVGVTAYSISDIVKHLKTIGLIAS